MPKVAEIRKRQEAGSSEDVKSLLEKLDATYVKLNIAMRALGKYANEKNWYGRHGHASGKSRFMHNGKCSGTAQKAIDEIKSLTLIEIYNEEKDR